MKHYRCGECSETFTRKWSCGRHIRDKHNGLGTMLDSDGMPVYSLSYPTGHQKVKTTNSPDVLYLEELIREIARLDARNIHGKITNNPLQIITMRKLLLDAYKNSLEGKGMFSEFFDSFFKAGG